MKKKAMNNTPRSLSHSRVLIGVVAVAFFLLLAAPAWSAAKRQQASTRVLGEETTSPSTDQKDQSGSEKRSEKPEVPETPETPETPEAPEPVETPELKETHKQESEKIHREIDQQVEKGKVSQIEITPPKNNQQTGILKMEQTNGQVTEKIVPVSQAPITTLQNTPQGNVAVSVNSNGSISLTNGDTRIETSYPVVIDPQNKTVSIKTETGLMVVGTLPSEFMPKLSSADKPTTTNSIRLVNQNNQPVYLVNGTQSRRFIGIFPVKASIETTVSAKDGALLSVKEPWYVRQLTFLYTL